MANYRAAWIPGIDDLDPDEALDLAGRWLATAQGVEQRIIVMNAVLMSGNSPALGRLCARFPLFSPRSNRPPFGGPKAVLAIYPDNQTLAWAEALARRGALCVVGWASNPMAWAARTGALNLADPHADTPGLPDVPEDVKAQLAQLIFFDGNNDFGPDGKRRAIPWLRGLIERRIPLTGEDLETLALADGHLRGPRGAAKLRDWYEGLQQGRRFKDSRGHYL